VKRLAWHPLHLVAVAATGLLLTGSFHPWNQAWLAWLVPVPWILVLRARPLKGLGTAWVWGWWGGLLHFATSLAWITEVTVMGWLALCLLMACYPACWTAGIAAAMQRLPQRIQPHHSIALALWSACTWTALEWVRGWLFTGFPWNPLGASQIEVLVVAQAAELGGALLVGWIVMFSGSVVGMTLLRVVQQARGEASMRPRLEFLTALALVGGVLWFGIGRLTRPAPVRGHLDVLLVQPRIPQDPWGAGMEAGEALDQTVRLTDLALPPGFVVDLVVWPETPIPEALLDLPRFEDFTRNLLPERAGALLYGTIRREGRVPYNSAVLALPGDEVAAVYDKTHLVVMGEYVPLGDVLPVLRRWVPLGTDFAPGEGPKVFELPSGWRLAPLICFEDVMARVVRRVAPLRPDVLVNITNDGWFNDSPQSFQHFQMARMRCIELRRPMIRASNNGVTGWIDERGVIRELLADPATGRVDIAGTVRVRVAIPEGRETLYARWGDWPGWICAVACLVVGWWRRRS
jgi:apolipoprotein N-acyltransferase